MYGIWFAKQAADVCATRYNMARLQDLNDINDGASLLASGGGGAFQSGEALIKLVSSLSKSSPARLIAPDEVGAEQRGCVVCGVGSPDAFAETLASGSYQSPGLALEELQKGAGGAPFDFVAPNETGCNIFIALLAAMAHDLPLLDANGAGRAVPKMDMLTFSDSLPAAPTVVVNEPPPGDLETKDFGARALLTAPTMADMEELLRPIVSMPEFGGVGAVASWVMSGAEAQKPEVAISGAVTEALELGKAMRLARASGAAPASAQDPDRVTAAVVRELAGRARPLFTGHLTSIWETTSGGFDVGILKLAGTRKHEGKTLTILNQNENLLCWGDWKTAPLVLAPDLISYLVGPDGQPYTNADLDGFMKDDPRWGLAKDHEIQVLYISPHAALRAPRLLEVWATSLAEAGYHGAYEIPGTTD